MSIRTAPCEWPLVNPAGCDFTETLESLPASGVAIDAATEFLWRWTGRKLGLCEQTVRPCRERCTQGVGTYQGPITSTYTPHLIAGRWYNIGCGACGDVCGCSDTPSLKLPGPVDSITEVLLGGSVLPPESYRVDNHSLLVRTDGGRWPTCQNMTAPPEDPDTWQVTYKWGIPVPVGGQIAAAVLAVEIAKALCGDTTCKLPRRVQSITREGIAVAVALDTMEELMRGSTGLWLVDSWVTSLSYAPQPPRVLSPDFRMDTFRRRTS